MAANNTFPLTASGIMSPYFDHAFAISTSDTVDLPTVTRAIYVGGAGAVTVDTVGGETAITFAAVPVGTVLPVRATRVRATGTAATNLVGLY